MKTLLLVDACVRGADSRTLRLACRLCEGCANDNVRLETLSLCNMLLTPYDMDGLTLRNSLCRVKKFNHPAFDLARQFKNADAVIIAAPFWYCGYPSRLHVYLERVCVPGLTFHFDDKDRVVGDCVPCRLVYVTTRGGYASDENPARSDHASAHLRSICAMLGVERFDCLAAEGLDLAGNDPEALLSLAEAEADQMADTFWD